MHVPTVLIIYLPNTFTAHQHIIYYSLQKSNEFCEEKLKYITAQDDFKTKMVRHLLHNVQNHKMFYRNPRELRKIQIVRPNIKLNTKNVKQF